MNVRVEYRYDLFADYFQFYVQDEAVIGDLSESWTREAVDRLLAVAPGTIGVGTVRNMTVPVTLRVTTSAPTTDMNEWDQVNECCLHVSSGRLVIAGCTDYLPDAARIDISSGTYRARLYYGGLDRLSDDGLEGEDHYEVVLWPDVEIEPRVLKQRIITVR